MQEYRYYKRQNGFTLIEILLSVGIIALLSVTLTPVFQSFQVRNDLDVATVSIAQSLRRAQALSQAVDGDTTWGVNIQSASTTVFKGASFVTRDITYDELFDVPLSITPSGLSSTTFAKLSGLPNATGTITLTSNINETRTITINDKGTILY